MMSYQASREKVAPSHTDEAIEIIQRCVRFMTRGIKTEFAIHEIARCLEQSPRRLRKFYNNDQPPIVLAHELAEIRKRSGLFALNYAEKIRKFADEIQEFGEENSTSRQMVLRLEEPCSRNNSGRRSSDASTPLRTDYLLSAAG